MEDNTVKELKKQHVDSYRKAICEILKNNTDVLIDEDITSLLRKPPLDSMDLIRVKFLDLAKKNKVILNTDELSIILNNYRAFLLDCCKLLKKIRVDELKSKVEKAKLVKENDIIKINKKDFTLINKEMKRIIKEQLAIGLNEYILKDIDKVFLNDIDINKKDRIIKDINKYISGSYQKSLLETFDIKILVKDTILINNTKEQSDRYLFTLNNSRLFQ